MSTPTPTSTSTRGFLKQASLQRLSMKIRDAQETLGRPLLFCHTLDSSQLEPSGLNVLEAEHVARWVRGVESGRHCMLALLECHRIEADLHTTNKSDNSKPVRFQDRTLLTSGAKKRSIHLTSLGKSVSLPDQYLCDSGVLFDSVFSRPPSAVLKEGLKILAEFASERSSTALTTDQINMGLKQIRVEKMIDVPPSGSGDSAAGKENIDSSTNQQQTCDSELGKATGTGNGKGEPAVSESKSAVEAYRLQIIIELLRLHIIKSTKENAQKIEASDKECVDKKSLETEKEPKLHSAFYTSPSDLGGKSAKNSRGKKNKKNKKNKKKVVPKVEQLFDTSLTFQQHQNCMSDEQEDEENYLQQQEKDLNSDENEDDIDISEDLESGHVSADEDEDEVHERFTLYAINPAPLELQTQLARRKEQHLQEAEALSERELSDSNRVLLPYISQLMALKGSLGSYIDYLEGSKAYLSFGLDKDCDAAALKKAYRAKAVKLHPDKKGGDKAKFQQLNDMYNEMLKVKLEESVVSEEIEAEWNADGDTINRALAVVGKLEGYVLDIKTATAACTELAQASLRWKKRVDKAGKLPCPKGIRRLIKLLKSPASDGDNVTVKSCSCLLAEEHLQIISVTVSLMVSELMALLSLGRYGVSTGKNIHLMKNIEHLAMCGLNVQKCVPSLSPIECQIDSLLPRAELSYELSQKDQGVHDVLVQMFGTSFHTRHLTMGMAADSCVTVALVAAEICLAVKQIIKLSDQDFKNNLKRQATQREQQDEYCDEDKAFMAEMAKKQQEASREQAREKEQQKEEEEERHREEGTEMEYLRGQVHSLQVQLRLQNMEALQTLNADVRAMQKKVQGHISEVTILDTNPSQGREEGGVNQDVGSVPTCTDSGNSGESSRRAVAFDEHSKSLFSLLAEFIDSSCVAFLNKRTVKGRLVVTDKVMSSPTLIMNAFEDSFGWLFALNRMHPLVDKSGEEDESFGPLSHNKNENEENNGVPKNCPNQCSCDEEDEPGKKDTSAQAEEDTNSNYTFATAVTNTRLALYPDFRSKVFLVCALLHPDTVRVIIEDEFRIRLLGNIGSTVKFSSNLLEKESERGKAVTTDVTVALEAKLASAVCDCILDGVNTAMQDMQ